MVKKKYIAIVVIFFIPHVFISLISREILGFYCAPGESRPNLPTISLRPVCMMNDKQVLRNGASAATQR